MDDERDDMAVPADDDMQRDDHETGGTDSADDRGTELAGMLAALTVGVVATALAALLWNQLTSGDDDGASTASADVPAARVSSRQAVDGSSDGSSDGAEDQSLPGVATAPRGDTRLARCSRAHHDLRVALDAAEASLEQWSVHVGAMNKLVVGEITLQQATDFWNDTRVGAQRRIDEFDAAYDDLRLRGVDCPDPGLLAPGKMALPSCSRVVQAEVATLRTAQLSIATWAEHVHHMEMLRLGRMTPQEATSMWLASWKQGVRELRDHDAAARVLRHQHGCDDPVAEE